MTSSVRLLLVDALVIFGGYYGVPGEQNQVNPFGRLWDRNYG